MEKILLCSYDPIFTKALMGVVFQEGYGVEVVDHAALAVQKAMARSYAGVILDSGSIGLPAEEAAKIINLAVGDVPVIVAGSTGTSDGGTWSIRRPPDLLEVTQVVRELRTRTEAERRGRGI
ncbi:MAG: hypothetical protein P8Y66_05220 [Nitrospirota bacterium]